MLPKTIVIIEGGFVLQISGCCVLYFSRAHQTGLSRVIAGLVVPAFPAGKAVAYEIIPFQAFDRQDVDSCAAVGAYHIHRSFPIALIEHGYGVVVIHGRDGEVAAVLFIVGVQHRFCGIVEEGLTEYAGTCSVIIALGVAKVVVKSEPSLESFLMDVGLDQILAYIVPPQNTLVLLHVEDCTVREFL